MPVRIELLEDDVDIIEGGAERLAQAVDKMRMAFYGAALTFSVSMLLLAVDIVRGR